MTQPALEPRWQRPHACIYTADLAPLCLPVAFGRLWLTAPRCDGSPDTHVFALLTLPPAPPCLFPFLPSTLFTLLPIPCTTNRRRCTARCSTHCPSSTKRSETRGRAFFCPRCRTLPLPCSLERNQSFGVACCDVTESLFDKTCGVVRSRQEVWRRQPASGALGEKWERRPSRSLPCVGRGKTCLSQGGKQHQAGSLATAGPAKPMCWCK